MADHVVSTYQQVIKGREGGIIQYLDHRPRSRFSRCQHGIIPYPTAVRFTVEYDEPNRGACVTTLSFVRVYHAI